MSNELSNLAPNPGSRTRNFRVGRGIGSGNGKTAGRGTKGQKSRSGSSLSPGFEGGQMPIQRRLPKRGFRNIFAVKWEVLNLDVLVELGLAEISPEILTEMGVISGRYPVKVLARGTVSQAMTVRAHAFSAEAQRKLNAVGGRAEVV